MSGRPTFDFVTAEPAPVAAPQLSLFASLSDDALLSIGVPTDWLAVGAATDKRFFALAEHLPGEAFEALLEYAANGALPVPMPATSDPFAHPDALRRIRPIADQDELERALAFPWKEWGVVVHVSQRDLTDRSFA